MKTIRLYFVALLSAAALLAQAPRIDSITPSQAPIAGGTAISIRGTNLAGATLTIDKAAIAASTTADELRFNAPKHDNGYAILRVATTAGTAATTFLYIPPRLQDLPAGYITTIAGVGPFYGDYGPATQAQVTPIGLAYAPDGTLYVAEAGHDRIIRIRPDGILEPFAGSGLVGVPGNVGDGGPSTAASVTFPRSVVVESNGDILFTDDGHRIRRVDSKTGIIHSAAGNGQAGFSGDGDLAVNSTLTIPNHMTGDGNGTVWFIDFDNHRIRRITPDGKIDTICGTGTTGFSGDKGPAKLAQFDVGTADDGDLAYDRAGFLYLADTANRRIRRINLADGTIDTFVGGDHNLGLQLMDLRSLAVDVVGDIYFYADAQIVHVSRDGQLREKLGLPNGPRAAIGKPIAQAGFGLGVGIALDSRGNVICSDATVNRIMRLNRESGLVENVAGIDPQAFGEGQGALAAALQFEDVAILPSGEIIFSGATRVRKIGVDGKLSVIAGTGTFAGPLENVPATESGWGGSGLEVAQDGSIYMVSTGTGIGRIDPQGIVHRFAGIGDGRCAYSGDGGPALQAGLCQPWDAALDRDGNLMIADTNNNRIRRVDGRTGIISTIAGSGPVNGYENYGQGSFCGDGGPALQACLNTPFGVVVNGDGELLVADQGNFRIRKIDRNGRIGTFANIQVSYMTVDPAGNVWAASRPALFRITPAGVVQTMAGGNTAGFGGDGGPASQALVNTWTCCISGVAIDGEGNLLFTDGTNRRLRAIRFGAVMGPPGAQAQTHGGTPQSAALSTRFSDALSVFVANADGSPAGNVRVDFAAPGGGASCLFSNQQGSIGVVTDRNGIASAVCTANTVTGGFTVIAVPLGTALSLKFALTNTAPRLVSNSVVNGASFLNGAVAPGEIVTIFGAGVGPVQLVQAAPVGGRFGTELAGVRVRFNGAEAPVLFARSDQAAVVAPYALDGATSAQVVVEYAGVVSNAITVPMGQASPAIFSADSSGRGQGAILNQDNSVNSAANPADRGSIVVLFCTGEGQTDPPGVDGKLANDVYPKPKLPVSVTIGGQAAEVLYYGAAPTLVAGVLQVNARVPSGIAPGSAVAVSISAGTVSSPSGITVAIR